MMYYTSRNTCIDEVKACTKIVMVKNYNREKRPRSPAEGDKLEKSKKRRIEAQPPKEVQTVEEIPIARQEEPVQVVEEEMEVVVEKPAVAPREQRVLEERTPKKMRVAKVIKVRVK